MKYALLFAVAGRIWAQHIQILPAPPDSSSSGSFYVMLVSDAGKEPVALQWSMRFSDAVTVALKDILPGKAAEAAKKALTCAPAGEAASGFNSTYTCILAGGDKPIPNGPITVARCAFVKKGHTALVRIEHIIGVRGDLKQTVIGPVEGTLTAKAK